MKFLIALLLLFTSLADASPSKTIYDESIEWNNQQARAKLLNTVPEWNTQQIQTLFNIYRHPEKYQLPRIDKPHIYNMQFIHVFWGPLNNPFNQVPRPAKAFVFVNDAQDQLDTYYLAPVIKNSEDQNYYIFDPSETEPLSLSTWINRLIKTNGNQTRFNICLGYGNFPGDSCLEKTYMAEAKDISNKPESNIQPISAQRKSYEHWQSHILRQQNLFHSGSILDSSIEWRDIKNRERLLDTIVSWPDYQTIVTNFEKMRDFRYFADSEKINFPRRISWLYPDDGCWTRATAAIRDLFGPLHSEMNPYSRPSKIFVFGNLCANTNNHPEGAVFWWYHTAPIIKDAQTNFSYVLDPAVDPFHPIALDEWVKLITANTGVCALQGNKIELFNICNGYGSWPGMTCDAPYQDETNSMLTQLSFLRGERERQLELGRDVDAVLGNQPPWIKL